MESQKFKHLEDNLTNLLYAIVSSQNLLRYIVYLDDKIDPLDPALSDVKPGSLIHNQILLVPMDISILKKEVVKIFVNPLEGNLSGQTLGNDTYIIDIAVPHSAWILKGTQKLRPFRIANEIARVIDGKNIAGFGQVEISKYRVYRLNENYSSLTLFTKVNSATIKA